MNSALVFKDPFESAYVYDNYIKPDKEEDERFRRAAEEERQEDLNNPEWRQNEIDTVRLNYKKKTNLSPCCILESAREFNVLREILELDDLGEEYTAYINFYNNLYSEIEKLAEVDDKDQFSAFLTKYHDKLLSFTPQDLFELLVNWSAVGCLTALLDSQLRSHVDVNHLPGGNIAIEIAAIHHSFDMVTLLLRHGADPDAGCSNSEIPLHFAIEFFRYEDCMYDWNPGKPIFELFNLIRSPELEVPLDTIRVLASQSKRVEYLCRIYIANRQLIHLATLLAVASDKLLVHLERGLENTPVGKIIFGELKCEANKKRAGNPTSSIKKAKLVDAFCVVKCFCLLHGVLEGLPILDCSLPFERLGELLVEGGPVIEQSTVDKDNIECLLSKLSLEAGGLGRLAQQHRGSIVHAFTGVQGQRMGIFSSLPMRSNSSYQAYCTKQGAHFNYPKLVETRLSKCTQVKPSSQNGLALMRKVAPIMWFAKRSMK